MFLSILLFLLSYYHVTSNPLIDIFQNLLNRSQFQTSRFRKHNLLLPAVYKNVIGSQPIHP